LPAEILSRIEADFEAQMDSRKVEHIPHSNFTRQKSFNDEQVTEELSNRLISAGESALSRPKFGQLGKHLWREIDQLVQDWEDKKRAESEHEKEESERLVRQLQQEREETETTRRGLEEEA
jgi:hypothetical protein